MTPAAAAKRRTRRATVGVVTEPARTIEAMLADGIEQSEGRSRKLSETVARRIVQEILDQKLEEGAQLPNERDMLERLGVARPTLREALRLLENLGIIVVKNGRNGGPVVRKPRPVDVGRLLSLVLEFEGMTVGAVLAARVQLEPILVGLAVQKITDAELAHLEAIVRTMATTLEDNDAFAAANADFHAAIVRASGDVVLGIVEAALRSICPTLSAQYSAAQRQVSLNRHKKILRCLKARDAPGAEAATREHLMHAIKYWRTHHAELRDQAMQWID